MSDDNKPVDGTTVHFDRNRISVRTEHGVSIAKKMARLRLLEERINAKDLITVYISTDGNAKIYLFEW